jgi:hypothetical protein
VIVTATIIVTATAAQAEIAAGSTRRANRGTVAEASILGPDLATRIAGQDHHHHRVVVLLLIAILRASLVQSRLALVQLTIFLAREVFSPAIERHRCHQDPRFAAIDHPRRQWTDFLEISLHRNEGELEAHLLRHLIVSSLATVATPDIRTLTVAHQVIVGSTTQSVIRF